jgi:hypothetical protein
MDYGKLLTRAFEITFKHRALWVFGILFALFGGSKSSSPGFGFSSGARGNRNIDEMVPTMPRFDQQTIVILIATITIFILVWFLLMLILRFVTRGALIGLVNDLETREKIPTVRAGFEIGLSKFKSLLGIGLIINAPISVAALALVLAAATPFLIALAASGAERTINFNPLTITGIASSLALLCCAGLCLWIVQVVVYPFYQFFTRACVIGARGSRDAIREGYRIVRAHLGKVIVLYVLDFAIGLGYGFLMIPIVLVLLGLAAGAGALTYLLAQSIGAAIAVGGIAAIPMFAILLIISGIFETFESTLWTEAYLAVTQSPPIQSIATEPAQT